MEDLAGKQLGPYRVVAPLGEGGMAAVYKAYQPGVDRVIALKVLPRHFAQDEEFVARFNREARVVARLQHPHILPVFDYGESEGYTYIAMPFIKGGTLSNLLKEGELLPLEQVEKFLSQVGQALDYAHARDLIHRDIKPSNILIDESGNCLLTDFGVARMTVGGDKLTTTGNIIGTPAYMSPEQGQGLQLDSRSDIYSLGIILYEMLTGRVPFRAETPIAVVVKHMHSPLPMPRSLNPDLPEEIEQVVLKALAKNRDDRYQTAGELVKDFRTTRQAVLAAGRVEEKPTPELAHTVRSQAPDSAPTLGDEAPSQPTGRVKETPAWSTLKWLPVALAVLFLVLVIGCGAWFVTRYVTRSSPTQQSMIAAAPTAAEPTEEPVEEAVVAEEPTTTPTPEPSAVQVKPPNPPPAPTETPTPEPAMTETPTVSVVETEVPPEESPTPTEAATNQSSGTASIDVETDFPLPPDARDFVQAAKSEQLMFRTDLSLDEVLQFYRDELTAQGLTERELLTNVTEATLSIVFDGASNGQSIGVQAVDLGMSTPEDERVVTILYVDL